MDAIDPFAVELACNDDGCVLIPDDDNPHNDIIVNNEKKDSGAKNVAIPSLDNMDVGLVPDVNPTPTMKNVIPLEKPT